MSTSHDECAVVCRDSPRQLIVFIQEIVAWWSRRRSHPQTLLDPHVI